MSSKRSALVGAALLAACLTTPISPAAPPSVIDALQRDLGLSESQVLTRLADEERLTAVEPVLAAALGPSYAGAWLSDDASRLLVATTNPAARATIESHGAQPVLVTRTLAQLDAIKRRIDRTARPTAPALWYVDVRTNTVTVQASTPAAARSLVAGVPGSVPAAPESPMTYMDIIGGLPFFNGSIRCTIGFSASQGSTPGFVTAGHCGSIGAPTTNPTGTFQGSSFPGNDYAWVAAPGNTPRPWVRGPGGTNVIVHGSTPSVVGASVCRSGPATGWHCGTVQQLNATIQYAQGTVYGLTRTNVCAEPGDSGGPFISSTGQAQGVTSGGSGTCATGGTTYFQPVNEILNAYRLTLTTA
jgi:streptogrisin C